MCILQRISKKRTVITGLIVIGSAVLFGWTQYGLNPGTNLEGLMVARWWRCQGANRPLLSTHALPWMLTYKYSGEAYHDLTVTVQSNGDMKLVGEDPDFIVMPFPDEREQRLTAIEVQEIADVVDETGLLCLTTHIRDGAIRMDSARVAIEVTSGPYSESIFIDGGHTVADEPAFDAVVDRLCKFQKRLERNGRRTC